MRKDVSLVQGLYGKDHLNLTFVKGYIAKLLGNGRVVRYLLQAHPEFLAEFQAIAELTSTKPSAAA